MYLKRHFILTNLLHLNVTVNVKHFEPIRCHYVVHLSHC